MWVTKFSFPIRPTTSSSARRTKHAIPSHQPFGLRTRNRTYTSALRVRTGGRQEDRKLTESKHSHVRRLCGRGRIHACSVSAKNLGTARLYPCSKNLRAARTHLGVSCYTGDLLSRVLSFTFLSMANC